MIPRSTGWSTPLDVALTCTRAVEPIYVGGVARMAEAFDAVETVRAVLRTLEEQYVVVSLVRDILDRGLSVAIGSELGFEPLAAVLRGRGSVRGRR